ncbi:MAG: copper transporter [Actinomycetota bacterium]
MISFRYHLVSIVAVFLALGLGLLAGTSVLDQELINRLRDQTEDAQTRSAELRTRVGELQSQIGQLEGFTEAVLPYLATGRLSGREVIILTQEGVDGAVLAEARDALDAADALVVAELAVTPKMASSDAGAQQELADVLGILAPADPGSLPLQAATALAERLATETGLETDPAAPDLLRDLLAQNFLIPNGSGISDATIGEIGGGGQVVVVLAGGQSEPFLAPESFMVPLVTTLVVRGVPVAAAEGTETTYPFVELLRAGDAAAIGAIVTVDDLDRTIGGVALVLGLQELVTTGHGGDYGVKDGAALIPPLP